MYLVRGRREIMREIWAFALDIPVLVIAPAISFALCLLVFCSVVN